MELENYSRTGWFIVFPNFFAIPRRKHIRFAKKNRWITDLSSIICIFISRKIRKIYVNLMLMWKMEYTFFFLISCSWKFYQILTFVSRIRISGGVKNYTGYMRVLRNCFQGLEVGGTAAPTAPRRLTTLFPRFPSSSPCVSSRRSNVAQQVRSAP